MGIIYLKVLFVNGCYWEWLSDIVTLNIIFTIEIGLDNFVSQMYPYPNNIFLNFYFDTIIYFIIVETIKRLSFIIILLNLLKF